MKRHFLIIVVVTTILVFGMLVWFPFRFALSMPEAPEEMLIQASDGRPLRISLWRGDEEDGPRPAILFVHGHTARGPEEPAYAILCDALMRQGLLVAAPWLRGYANNKSHNLGSQFVPSRWTPLPDIAGAFAFLRNDPKVDPDNIIVVGHSLGGWIRADVWSFRTPCGRHRIVQPA